MNKFLHFVRNLKLGSTFGMLILVVMWPTPTLGLLITSLRPSSLAETSPWWEALFNPLSTIWTIAAYQNSLSSGMLDSLINTIAVTIPATILPLMIGQCGLCLYLFELQGEGNLLRHFGRPDGHSVTIFADPGPAGHGCLPKSIPHPPHWNLRQCLGCPQRFCDAFGDLYLAQLR